ncbi:LysR family transcriptional regulator [Bacillus xiapuensis]|uniref:LysR family transcriptional regulator n=1 Tax=Bacillus xiapuensis TaxID=2014075 RepID=UPI000C23C3EC|nr:LysR family transcriptional regulator [Bacillus xiapuensis]
MEIRQFVYFTEVAKLQSFTKAAESLHVSQPALSKMVKNLEEEMGVQLLDRKNLKLTDAGKIVYDKARNILQQVNDLSSSLSDLTKLKKGTLHIGIPSIIGTLFFPTIIAQFRRLYPGITIKMSEHGARTVEKRLEEDLIELGIAVLPVDEQSFETVPFIEEDIMVIMRKNHPLSHRQSLTLKDVQKEDFVFFQEDFTLHGLLKKACRREGFEASIVLESNQWDFVAEMVEADLGISFFPYSLSKRLDPERISLVPLDNDLLKWKLAVILKKNRYISFAAREFLKLIIRESPHYNK